MQPSAPGPVVAPDAEGVVRAAGGTSRGPGPAPGRPPAPVVQQPGGGRLQRRLPRGRRRRRGRSRTRTRPRRSRPSGARWSPPALVGELLPAPLAHGAPRLPLSGTALFLLRVGAGLLVAEEGVAVGVVQRGRQRLLALASQPPCGLGGCGVVRPDASGASAPGDANVRHCPVSPCKSCNDRGVRSSFE